MDKKIFYFYTLLLVLLPSGFTMPFFSYPKVVFFVSIIVFIYNLIKNKADLFVIIKKRYIKVVSLLFLILFFTMLFSTSINSILNKYVFINDFVELIRPILYYIILINYSIFFHKNNFKKQFENCIIISFVIQLFVTILEFFNPFNINKFFVPFIASSQTENLLGHPTYVRTVGLTDNPNLFGFLLSIYSCYFLYKILKEKKKLLFIILYLLNYLCIFTTMSRTGLICLVSSNCILIFLDRFYKKEYLKSVIRNIIFLLLVLLSIFILPDKITMRYKDLIFRNKLISWELRKEEIQNFDNNYHNSSSDFDKTENLQNGTDKKNDNAIITHKKINKNKTFILLFGYSSDKEKVYHSGYDNEFLSLLFKYGIIGLLIIIYIIIFIASTSMKYKPSFKQFLISIMCSSFLSMYTSGFFEYYNIFIIYIIFNSFIIFGNKKNIQSNTVLYINYVDLKDQQSGSSVRPKKIYDAFVELGYDVKMLSCSTLKSNKKERIKKIKEIENYLEFNLPKYCYIESPSGYITFKKDRDLIKIIHENEIKIGYFYRDIYYKISDNNIIDNAKNNILSKENLKNIYHKFMNRIDEEVLKKYVDVVFFPTKEMNNYCNFKRIAELPPAANKINIDDNNEKEGAIYVGGLSYRYGTELLLKSFELINKTKYLPLTIICREKEMSQIDKKYYKEKWLNIVNSSGQELEKYYKKAKIAIIPILKNKYNDFAISVKLFEYMSYNLPIVATNCNAQKKIITEEKIGVISKCKVKDFALAVETLYFDEVKIKQYKDNIKKSLKNKNLWIHRIKKIEKELLNEG